MKLLGNNLMLLRLAAKLCWVELAGVVQGRSWSKSGLLPDFVHKGAQTDTFALCSLQLLPAVPAELCGYVRGHVSCRG